MAEMQTLIAKYVAWLKDKTSLRQLEDWIEITTPYLDRHNDYLQIYARRLNGGFLLTDDGYVLEDLQQSGCKIESPKRQALLKMTLGGFGVRLNQNAMEVQASAENFALRNYDVTPVLWTKREDIREELAA